MCVAARGLGHVKGARSLPPRPRRRAARARAGQGAPTYRYRLPARRPCRAPRWIPGRDSPGRAPPLPQWNSREQRWRGKVPGRRDPAWGGGVGSAPLAGLASRRAGRVRPLPTLSCAVSPPLVCALETGLGLRVRNATSSSHPESRSSSRLWAEQTLPRLTSRAPSFPPSDVPHRQRAHHPPPQTLPVVPGSNMCLCLFFSFAKPRFES